MAGEEKSTVGRRRLIGRAGAVAVGLGAAGAAAALNPTAAAATDGNPIVQGATNTGADTTTTIANNSATKAPLALSNSGGGAQLTLAGLTEFPDTATDPQPGGSIAVDQNGYQVNYGGLGQQYYTYSEQWSSMTVPVPPFRILDTRVGSKLSDNTDGRTHAKGAVYSGNRVVPKNSATVPDLVLDLSAILSSWGPDFYMAVQGNLTAVENNLVKGWVAVYGDEYRNTSNLNYHQAYATANFVQCQAGLSATTGAPELRFKVSSAVALVFDLMGFVVSSDHQVNRGFFAVSGVTSARAVDPDKRQPRLRQ